MRDDMRITTHSRGEEWVAELQERMADGRWGHLLMVRRASSEQEAVENVRLAAARLGYDVSTLGSLPAD
jgi:hypothetical protein